LFIASIFSIRNTLKQRKGSLTGLEGLISNPAISPRRSEAVGNPENPVNPVEEISSAPLRLSGKSYSCRLFLLRWRRACLKKLKS
jgi:hypothetical protein